MENKTQKDNRMQFLDATLWKYLNTSPQLSAEDIAVVIANQLCGEELTKFIKKYKKEIK